MLAAVDSCMLAPGNNRISIKSLLPAVVWAAAKSADMHLQYFNYIMHVDSQTQVWT